ncbi:hypothetical protein IHE45_16G046600 [Dioscorea alata]|uniref:Uncharacterized protein n=1 Tax=Dioscorea alata TaxID=55571 RepID=A0ACB7UH77_DIOAL|nr:hypothetical protein IHE45_16G046600 [Dioscorea alata]
MPSHSRSCSNPNFSPPHLAKLDHLAIIWQATGILIVHGFMEMRMRWVDYFT